MGGTCSVLSGNNQFITKLQFENLKGRDNFGHLGIDGRTILVSKIYRRMLTVFMRFRTVSCGIIL
jgi:hypothetical protein